MTKQRFAPAIAAVLTALIVAGVVHAQSVGIAITKDSTLRGTGSSGSAMGVNTTTLAGGSGLTAPSSTTLAVGAGSGVAVSADAVAVNPTGDFKFTGGQLDMGNAVTLDGSLEVATTLDADAAATLVGDFRGKVLNISGISGTLDNWAPTGHASATHIAITGSAPITLTGLAGGVDGRMVVITNMELGVAAAVELRHQNAGSVAANRFDLTVDATWHLQYGESITFIYNGASSRWVQIGTRIFPQLFAYALQVAGTAIITTVNTDAINGSEANTVVVTGRIGVAGMDPVISACGTSPTVVGTDLAGIITVGSGTATSCTVTLATTADTEPSCVLASNFATAGLYFSAKSATAFTIAAIGGGNFAGSKIDFHCFKM